MDDCIEWTGKHWNTGYPYRMGGERGHRKMIAVHREVWEEANGPIPPGRCVMHTCDNPGCINIEHLRVGTPKENTQDMVVKRRHRNNRKTHCPNGHEYDRTVTRRSGPRAGTTQRYCSICQSALKREAYRRRN